MTTPGAPREARAREVLAKLAIESGEFASIHFEGPWNPWAIAVQAMIEFATAPTPAAEEVEGLPAGMVPWHGGDSAPEDWDGGPVKFREAGLSDQQAVVGAGPLLWEHFPHAASFDIIAYTPRAPSTQLQPDGAGFNENDDPLKVAEEMRERCARACEDRAQDFLSPEYAVPQPLGSIQERFACGECATAIRALPLIGAGARGESNP